MTVYEEQAKAEVLARFPCAIGNPWLGCWTIYPNEGPERQNDRLGDGATEGAAWIESRNNLPPQQLPARHGEDGPRKAGRTK